MIFDIQTKSFPLCYALMYISNEVLYMGVASFCQFCHFVVEKQAVENKLVAIKLYMC